MQRITRLATWVGWSLYLITPALLFAQAGIPSKIVPCSGIDCKVCDLAVLAQNLINTGIYVVIFLAAMLFAYAGFLMLTNQANPGVESKAKKIFSNVVIGLVVILSAWLVVDVLMKTLLGGSFGPWNDLCQATGF